MTLTKSFSVTAVIALLGAALSGCASSSSGAAAPSPVSLESGTTMATLAEKGTVRVGTKFDQPGFGVKGLDGKPEGFDVEIAKIIVNAMGMKDDQIEWVETPSAVREESLVTGKVDFITATYVINSERQKRVSFAGPYYETKADLIVSKDNNDITSPDYFKSHPDAKVCSGAGSADSSEIRKYLASPSQQVEFDVQSKCSDALRTGQVEAVTGGEATLHGMMDKNEGLFRLVGSPFLSQPNGVGITKGDVKFCEFINGALSAAVEDGRYAEAWKATAGKGQDPATYPTPIPCS